MFVSALFYSREGEAVVAEDPLVSLECGCRCARGMGKG